MASKKPASGGKGTRALAPIGDYPVGYGKPPKAHQFQAGQPSANPKGRPPAKRRNNDARAIGFSNELHAMTIEEAMRPVQVRDGNKVVKIPAWQAALRAAHLKASTGNPAAFRAVTKAVQDAQAALRAEKEEEIAAVLNYKKKYADFARQCDAQGKDHGLEIHPDDVHIDLSDGSVIIVGPKTPEEREVYKIAKDGVRACREFLIKNCEELRENPKSRSAKERIVMLVDVMEKSNEILPKRDRINPHQVLREQGVEME
jgi:hypothetical protein